MVEAVVNAPLVCVVYLFLQAVSRQVVEIGVVIHNVIILRLQRRCQLVYFVVYIFFDFFLTYLTLGTRPALGWLMGHFSLICNLY